MKILVYSLTRDRLEFTKHCFGTMRRRAGFPYTHVVLDNGSQDGTVEWLQSTDVVDEVVCLPENVGIARACNLLRDRILRHNPDIVIKMDNDCEVLTTGILDKIARLYTRLSHESALSFEHMPVLSPHVSGLRTCVKRLCVESLCDHEIGWTQIVGGLFHVVPVQHYRRYRYNEVLPKAFGNDGDFCLWLRERKIPIGYIEDLHVAHYLTTNGQEAALPDYFARKRAEEK